MREWDFARTTWPHAGARLYFKRYVTVRGSVMMLRVLLDGIEIGRLRNGELQTYDILPGTYEISVRMGWTRSNSVFVTCEKGDLFDIHCCSPVRLPPLYRLADTFLFPRPKRRSRPFLVTVSRHGENPTGEE